MTLETNYPYRYGAFKGRLQALAYNAEINKLFDYDLEKMKAFQRIIELELNAAENSSRDYEEQYNKK